MDIKLLTTNDPNNKVVKTYTENQTISGDLKDACSVLKPSIIIEVGSIPTSNYAYIADFGRYYFIDNITVIAPKQVDGSDVIRDYLIQIDMSVDVLMTYANGIKNLDAVISRQENVFNTYLHDNAFKALANPQIETWEFPFNFGGYNPLYDTNNIFLVVAGND